MQIHPYLIARLYAIKAAFNEQWAINNAPTPASKQNPAFNWDELLNKTGGKSEDDGDDGEGGGGTIKGFKKSNKDLAQSMQSPAFNWDEFLNKTGDKSEGDGESGGGTMKGFKKSNKDPAQSMRRLGRS